MNEFESRKEERHKWREERREARKKWMEERWNDKNYRAMHRRSSIGTGVFIVLIGLAFLIRNSVPDLPPWLFTWQTLLIAMGVFIGVKHRFRGAAWFILILVGSAFLMKDIIPNLELQRYIWPMVLITVGLFFIFRPRGYRR